MFLNNSSIIEACISFPDLPKKDGDIVYVHPNKLGDFVKEIDTISCRFVLVTCGSDTTIPYGMMEESKLILKSDKLICWFASNAMITCSKLRNLPIGIDYHTDKKISKENQNNLILKIAEEAKGKPKINKIYGNFHFNLDITFRHDRLYALKEIPSHLIDYEKERVPREECYKKMTQYKYIASPFGNGLECHRTWEALALGCIPIVKSSCLDCLYEDLPVLIVNSWSSISLELLDSFDKKGPWKLEKLTADYWINEIQQIAKSNLFITFSKEMEDKLFNPVCYFDTDNVVDIEDIEDVEEY